MLHAFVEKAYMDCVSSVNNGTQKIPCYIVHPQVSTGKPKGHGNITTAGYLVLLPIPLKNVFSVPTENIVFVNPPI